MVNDLRLSSTAKTTFSDINNEIYLSLASAWEMAIKASLKKLKLPLPVKEICSVSDTSPSDQIA